MNSFIKKIFSFKLGTKKFSPNSLRTVGAAFFAFILFINLFAFAYVKGANAAAVPSILTYQGRLTDSSGNLLGGSGTSYYFKFSLWNNSTVGNGSKVWPASNPTSYSTTVKQGVFNVNIGDTANGYPDTLDYNFSDGAVYLQVEVSSNGTAFETLSPRQLVSSSAFSKLSGAVSGTGQSSFGTTTPHSNSVVTIEATSTDVTALTILASGSQSAPLFSIKNSLSNPLFYVNNAGGIFSSSTLSVTGASTLSGGLIALASSTLQNFTGINATTTNATSTSLYASSARFNTANITNLGLTGLSDGCLNIVSGSVGSVACGSGTGSSGGTLSTTTSQVLSRLINYSNSTTDIVAIGGTSTTTAKYWFDPNTQTASLLGLTSMTNFLANGSSTLQNFTAQGATTTSLFTSNASTTNLFATAITSGLINGQNISSSAVFTGTASINGLTTLSGGFLALASSTLQNFTARQGTTTTFAISSITPGTILKTSTGGTLIPAPLNTDNITPSATPLSSLTTIG